MMTAVVITGILWFAAALVFTLALMRRAGRPMPHPLDDLNAVVSRSRRRLKWSAGSADFECRHRHASRTLMPPVGVRRLGEIHVANLRAPRRMRRSPSAESEA